MTRSDRTKPGEGTGAESSSPTATERDRDAILARRRLLVASALASVVATGCDKIMPQPCLEPPLATTDAGGPTICLAVPMQEDVGAPDQPTADAAGEGDAGTARTEGEAPPPGVCLSVPAPRDAGPSPRVCLSPVKPPPR